MLHASPLGKDSEYSRTYAPDLLFPVQRSAGRALIGLPLPLPFLGEDIWTAYEISWLNSRGKPCVAIGEFRVPADSENLIESKSFKLYLNSLNNTRFTDAPALQKVLERDLSRAAGGPVQSRLQQVEQGGVPAPIDAQCIDDEPISIDTYRVNPDYLQATPEHVAENLCSHVFRSNCPVTGQPDWASIVVGYRGPQLDRPSLLRYLVSFRDHTAFHEQCVEQIFSDIRGRCAPTHLTVYARFTRRGGLDINPFRSNFEAPPRNVRTFRQ